MVFMKKVIISISIVVLVLISGFLTFILVTTPRTKKFEGRGVEITLASDFKIVENENYDFYVTNDEIYFMSTRLGKLSNITDTNGTKHELSKLTLNSYLALVLATYGLGTEDNNISIYYMENYYEDFYYCYYKDGNSNYAYMLIVADSENFFYTMNIACAADKIDEYRTKMLQYAITIEVE